MAHDGFLGVLECLPNSAVDVAEVAVGLVRAESVFEVRRSLALGLPAVLGVGVGDVVLVHGGHVVGGAGAVGLVDGVAADELRALQDLRVGQVVGGGEYALLLRLVVHHVLLLGLEVHCRLGVAETQAVLHLLGKHRQVLGDRGVVLLNWGVVLVGFGGGSVALLNGGVALVGFGGGSVALLNWGVALLDGGVVLVDFGGGGAIHNVVGGSGGGGLLVDGGGLGVGQVRGDPRTLQGHHLGVAQDAGLARRGEGLVVADAVGVGEQAGGEVRPGGAEGLVLLEHVPDGLHQEVRVAARSAAQQVLDGVVVDRVLIAVLVAAARRNQGAALEHGHAGREDVGLVGVVGELELALVEGGDQQRREVGLVGASEGLAEACKEFN